MTTILITGVHRGIGREMAKQALAKGWRVIGSVRYQEHADEALVSLGTGFFPIIFDVTDQEAIERAAATIDEPIDILINNSGVIGPGRQSSLDMDFHGFELTLAINTIGPLRVSQAFLQHLRKSDNGRLLIISSIMGSMAQTSFDRIAYRASKAGVNKVLQGLASDLEPEGIAAVSIHPGWVRTDMGGPNASIAPEASAAGILEIADRLSLSATGRFLNYDGSEIDW